MKVLAIDLGSNSLTIIKYDCSKKRQIYNFLKTVRTAEGLVDSGIISSEAVGRVIDAINEAKEILNFSDTKVKAVTTQALRVAKNAKEVVEKIYKSTGVKFKIITPKEEGELTLKAVKNRLELLGINSNFVLVDIGGGSTELSYYIDGKIYSKSFELGIVTTANSCNSLEEIEDFVAKKIKEIKDFAKEFNNKELIFSATAGTPTTLAAMKLGLNYETYDANLVTGTKLSLEEIDFYLNRLLKMNKKERQIAVGVGRDDLIVAGVIIFKEIYKILEKNEAIVIDDGLSMGVAISEC
jgi:exopolyphosphatase/guanosine-5'-triphosphate,3'-diphosphate pyrophosphatase